MPTIERAVQDASNNLANLLSRTAPGRVSVTGNFHFGVGKEGGGSGPEVPQVGEAA